MSSGINTILFDVGNVLVCWRPDVLINELMERYGFDDRSDIDLHFKTWQPMWDRSNLADTLVYIEKENPEYFGFMSEFISRIPEALSPLIEGSEVLAGKLKAKGYNIFAASNFPADKFNAMRPVFPFLKYFDGVFISGEHGVIKPDPAFFETLMDEFDVKAEDALFIDDIEENVEAARGLGITCILFKSPEQLEVDLIELGVL